MTNEPQQAEASRALIGWRVLTVLLALEAIGAVGMMWPVLRGLFGDTQDPLGLRVSVLLAALLSAVWVVVTLIGSLRRAGWARGSAVTIHVLMFAAGTGVLRGIFAEPLIGWGLVVFALAGFVAAVLARPPVDPAAS